MERSSRAHDRGQAAEIARIETAYKLRDASSSATYSFANPGYAFYLQALEWSLLETLRRGRTGAPTGPPTVTVGIDVGELGRIFPRTQIHYASAALAFGLCGIAGRSYLAARLLAALPPLREHGIAVVVKQPTTGDRWR